MRFKIPERKLFVYKNEFLIFPRRFNGYKYWLCWVTIQYVWLGEVMNRYSRFGTVVKIGKHAKELENKYNYEVL